MELGSALQGGSLILQTPKQEWWPERYQSLWGRSGRTVTSMVIPTPQVPRLWQLVDFSVHTSIPQTSPSSHQLLPNPITQHLPRDITGSSHHHRVCQGSLSKDRAVPVHFI